MESMENEQQIQQQMAETRASLAEKLETLEQKVVGTVEGATTAVSETVDVIKDSVQETVTAVNDTVKESVETVKDWVDVKAHVREHPWLMMGGSVAVGYCLGSLIGKAPQSAPYPPPTYPWMHQNNGGAQEERPTVREAPAASAPSALKSALSTWAPEVDKLKGLALGVLFGTARELVASSMTGHVGEQVKEIFDSVTKKLGGEPIPSADLPEMLHPENREERNEQEAEWQYQRGYSPSETTGRRW